MKTVVFKLPTKETKVINDRYVFVDGKMSCDEHTAKLLEPILVPYYGCTMTVEAPEEVAEKKTAEKPSLAKAQTSKST